MVLHVPADAAQLMYDRHADPAEMLGIADTRQLQDVRRADRAGRQDHLAGRVGALEVPRAAARELDCDGALAVEHERGGPAPWSPAAGWAASAPGADRCAPSLARRRPPRVCWHQPMLSPAPGGRLFTSSRYSSPISRPASTTAAQSGERSILEVNSGPPWPRTSSPRPPSVRPSGSRARDRPRPSRDCRAAPSGRILGLAADVDEPVDR